MRNISRNISTRRSKGIVKSADPFLRLTFITGVTKFTKTSIFSELNNLLDITLTEKYSDICGIAIEDLNKYFNEHIERLVARGKLGDYNRIHNKILDGKKSIKQRLHSLAEIIYP